LIVGYDAGQPEQFADGHAASRAVLTLNRDVPAGQPGRVTMAIKVTGR